MTQTAHPIVTPPDRHPLRALLVGQFTGAFNDNALKFMLLVLIQRPLLAAALGDVEAQQRITQQQSTLALTVFLLPMILLSPLGGYLADHLCKRRVLLLAKGLETGLLTAAAALLFYQPDAHLPLLVILGGMGAQSALFGPAKYGILPELLPHQRLSWGNGLLEMWTMLAIIAGTALGPALLLPDHQGELTQWTFLAPALLALCSVVGFIAMWFVPTPQRQPSNGETRQAGLANAWRAVRQDRPLTLAFLGLTLYWLAISLVGQNVYVFAQSIASNGASREIMGGLAAGLFGIGLAGGAVLAGRWSRGKVEMGLAPLGALGFAFAALLLGLLPTTIPGGIVLVALLGGAAGLMVVPLNALVQWRSHPDCRGSVIALLNIVTLAGALLGSLGAGMATAAGVSQRWLMLGSGIGVTLGALWALWLLPAALVRLVMVLATHSVYRVRIAGQENVPATGGALLCPNHMSFVDGLLLIAALDRPVRFVVDSFYYRQWWLHPLAKLLGAIPITASEGPRALLRSLKTAGKALDEGEIVCIFPEGRITRTGALNPFRRGLQRIVRGRDVPIIPVHLANLWGSLFSYAGGRFVFKAPKHLRYPTGVWFGKPLPADSSIVTVRQQVQDLGAEAWIERYQSGVGLQRRVTAALRRRGGKILLRDSTGQAVTGYGLLTRAVLLAQRLKTEPGVGDNLGILLPPSAAGAALNLAAALSGRTAVNLNYTIGPAALESVCQQANLQVVITSQAFLEKLKTPLPASVRPLLLEDLAPQFTTGARLRAALQARWLPQRWLERTCGMEGPRTVGDRLAIIFSSGSSGAPKGVELTHGNLLANIDQVTQIMHPLRNDRMLALLPLFHSFGYLSLWYALCNGLEQVCHPNPLDADAVGRLCMQHQTTLLIATPTFLQLYLRRCDEDQLASLRVVLTGAEKLQPRLADAFAGKFGIRPIEGYGATECSPVIAANMLDVRYPGVYQSGQRVGSVGRLMPGMTARIVDSDTFAPVEEGKPGLLLVRGPNVMRSYLNKPELTAHALRDGWYVTGDIGRFDDDGFLHLTDRLSRFSKIGGEMVPHGTVEQALQDALGETRQCFAVTGVPDARKGEKLMVLHTLDDAKLEHTLAQLQGRGLPNLFVPRRDQCVRVEELPLLGSGKMDLQKIKEIARQAAEGAAE